METLKEHFSEGGMGSLTIRYLGDNMILITGHEGEDLGRLIGENKELCESLFESTIPWSKEQIAGNKIVWLRCRGLPLTLWNEECLRKVVAPIGPMVSTTDTLLLGENLEYVRFKARLHIACKVQKKVDMKINDTMYHITLEKEMVHEHQKYCTCASEYILSNNSISIHSMEKCSFSDLNDLEHGFEIHKDDPTIESLEIEEDGNTQPMMAVEQVGNASKLES